MSLGGSWGEGSVLTERVDRRSFLAVAAGSVAGVAGFVEFAGVAGVSGVPALAARTRRARVAKPAARTLQQAIRGHVFYRGQPGWSSVYPVYNERFDGVVPSAVARPVDALDVRDAVRWLVANGQPFRARSGGHSYAGYSTLSNGVVLDLRRLNEISVNHVNSTAAIGAGCRLSDVYAGLASRGATIPAGSCPTVGVSGVTLGGGMGLAGRKFGLSLDNLISAQIVTADGKLWTVDHATDADLLWALRGGGGGNFGVVTQFVFHAHPLPASASYFKVRWPWSSASAAVDAWQHWAPFAADEVTSILHIEVGGSIFANGQYLGPSSDFGSLLGPLLSVPGASLTSSFDRDYLGMQQVLAGSATGRATFNAKSDYVGHPLSASGRDALTGALQMPGADVILCDAYGGAINRVGSYDTAFVHRRELFCMQYLSYNGNYGWLGNAKAAMAPYTSGHAYQNYIDIAQPNWQYAYYGNNYARLKATRRRVDPHHVFKFPQAIG